MKHSVVFDGCDNHWDNALPFGNGVFGCMLFYEDDRLYMPMNHYEVYYNISKRVLPEDIYNATGISNTPGALHKSVRERADFNRPPEGQPFCLYRTDRDKTELTVLLGHQKAILVPASLYFLFPISLKTLIRGYRYIPKMQRESSYWKTKARIH